MQKDLGLYLHIPFCKSKCAYCDFYSLPHSESCMDSYVECLRKDLFDKSHLCKDYIVSSVFLGGGTPSYLGGPLLSVLLHQIYSSYTLSPDCEITIEANPDSVTDELLSNLSNAGVNRLSLGVQTFDPILLQTIGRIHTISQVKTAVQKIREHGFANLSLDLIYGLPNQTMSQWKESLVEAVALSPEHLSCYGLKIEPGTKLALHASQHVFPDEDETAEMYLFATSYLSQHGFKQYEISNFAKPGFSSRHNLRYWRMQEYLGFGPGAHSDFEGTRFAYEQNLAGYLKGSCSLSEKVLPSLLERSKEYIMLSLRTWDGLDENKLKRTYGISLEPTLSFLQQCEKAGYLSNDQSVWKMTPSGYLVSNSIISQIWQLLSIESTN